MPARRVRILDLPGTYSVHPRSPDEQITGDVLAGRAQGEKRPDLVVCVVDATNLRRNLRLVLAVKRLGRPCLVALNMVDLAEARASRSTPTGCPRRWACRWSRTVGVARGGDAALRRLLDDAALWQRMTAQPSDAGEPASTPWPAHSRPRHGARDPASDSGSTN